MTHEFNDLEAGIEPIVSRSRRFVEECKRIETQFGISIQDEINDEFLNIQIDKIKSGETDVVLGLNTKYLWYTLLSLHFDLYYILWDKR